MTRNPRALSLLVALLAVLSLIAVPVASPAFAAAHRSKHDRRDPASDMSPSASFVHACRRVGAGVGAQTRCAHAAMGSFDRARGAEGMPPMALPADWAHLSPTVQLLTVTDIERVDRGLRPAAGLAPALNAYARKGADADTDPPFPAVPHGTLETSNWAGVGTSVLLADFIWMYDDGPGSVNIDCQSDGIGCWGHRRNILRSYAGPLAAGAAWTRDAHFGASIGMEWVGGDQQDRLAGTRWSSLRKEFSPGASPGTVHVARDPHLTLSASGTAMRLHLSITNGAAHWSVDRRTCTLPAGTSCTVTVSRHGSGAGHGTLLVTGTGASRHIPLRA